MANNSRTTFTKRAKERARQERQAEKAAKRLERKDQTTETAEEAAREVDANGNPVIKYDEEGQPEPLDFHDF